jgi:hypothetical protein
MKRNSVLLLLLFIAAYSFAQNWTLKLTSNVELRTWKLTSSASMSEKSLGGASIALYKEDVLISQTSSDQKGDFVIDVPPNGDFLLKISFAGCNTKKFFVTTKGVPENVSLDNYKPTILIGGFVMSKPFKGVDYIGLNEPLVKVEYKGKGQNFDKDEVVTNNGMDIISKIYDAENTLIQKFCNYNKLGDDALKKNNCPLAKSMYIKAMDLLPEETYPAERIKLAEDCIQKKKVEEQEKAVLDAKKAEEQKLALEKKKAEAEIKKKADEERSNNAAKKVAGQTVTKKNEVKQADVSSNKNTEKKENVVKPLTTGETDRKSTGGTGNSKYSVKQVLGTDKYKESIKRADDYYKTKRYKEAKDGYNEALKFKPNDPYATSRLSDIEKIQAPK